MNKHTVIDIVILFRKLLALQEKFKIHSLCTIHVKLIYELFHLSTEECNFVNSSAIKVHCNSCSHTFNTVFEPLQKIGMVVIETSSKNTSRIRMTDCGYDYFDLLLGDTITVADLFKIFDTTNILSKSFYNTNKSLSITTLTILIYILHLQQSISEVPLLSITNLLAIDKSHVHELYRKYCKNLDILFVTRQARQNQPDFKYGLTPKGQELVLSALGYPML